MKNLIARIVVTKDGPYQVSGELPISEQHIVTNEQGESLEYREGKKFDPQPNCLLCRCGHSESKPYCDGTHAKIRFDGAETAGSSLYSERATTLKGPSMSLFDDESLCAFARFCDLKGQVWNLVQEAGAGPAAMVKFEVGHCPSGRLTALDNVTGEAVEPAFEPSLGLIEDTARNVSGPIWVRGGIQIESANGEKYEVRNRVTLCRCGRSSNKPFCDGSHAS